jgi:hypothetical protein
MASQPLSAFAAAEAIENEEIPFQTFSTKVPLAQKLEVTYQDVINVPYWLLKSGTSSKTFQATDLAWNKENESIAHLVPGHVDGEDHDLLAHTMKEADYALPGGSAYLSTLSRMREMRSTIDRVDLPFEDEYKLILSRYVTEVGFDFNSYAKEAVYKYGEAYQYEGYDPEVTRSILNLKIGSDPVKLIHIICLYIFCGNNYPSRLKKVKNLAAGQHATQMLVTLGVKIRKEGDGKSALTLSRIASSYIGVLIFIRKMLLEMDLLPKPSFATRTPLLMCDLCLSGFCTIEIDQVSKALNEQMDSLAASIVTASMPIFKVNDDNDFHIKMNNILYEAFVFEAKKMQVNARQVAVMSPSQNASRLVLFNNLARSSLQKDIFRFCEVKYNLNALTVDLIDLRNWCYFYGCGSFSRPEQLIAAIKGGSSGKPDKILPNFNGSEYFGSEELEIDTAHVAGSVLEYSANRVARRAVTGANRYQLVNAIRASNTEDEGDGDGTGNPGRRGDPESRRKPRGGEDDDGSDNEERKEGDGEDDEDILPFGSVIPGTTTTGFGSGDIGGSLGDATSLKPKKGMMSRIAGAIVGSSSAKQHESSLAGGGGVDPPTEGKPKDIS